MTMKTSLVMVLSGAVVIGLIATSVSAERENEFPDAVVIHDASNGETGLEEPIVVPSEDREMVIAPNPISVDTGQEQENQLLVIMPCDPNEFIGLTEEAEESNTQDSAASALGPLGIVVILGSILATKRRKKIE